MVLNPVRGSDRDYCRELMTNEGPSCGEGISTSYYIASVILQYHDDSDPLRVFAKVMANSVGIAHPIHQPDQMITNFLFVLLG